MNEILYIHDLFEIYPEYIPENALVLYEIRMSKKSTNKSINWSSSSKSTGRVKEANREIGTKNCNTSKYKLDRITIIIVLNHTKEIRTKYYYLQQQKELPF